MPSFFADKVALIRAYAGVECAAVARRIGSTGRFGLLNDRLQLGNHIVAGSMVGYFIALSGE
jgi:hypothetical protein